ncbi:phospho-sugar mutase [Jongsikchunia kroppenstedtii]|uniref:phospho-sugar mutase n=1 Tax=Jongsikchunia kroppenstedtii TaxID=1121721 RepID=UPI0003609D4C|nr:phospho-sugar mutase [Jongsikchunia kroppenstedtii]
MTDLRFGTAGLRGPVREGPTGMNVATVTRVTAAVAEYLARRGLAGSTVVVGRDARTGSEQFAAVTAEVLAARGFDVVALPGTSPTPLVAFTARDLGAAAGIQITASHNPATDNGYKVYLDGGAQLVPPADTEIETLLADAPSAERIPLAAVAADGRAAAAMDRYLARLADRFGRRGRRLRIALTPMHGVGGELAVRALRQAGFHDIHTVAEQFEPDPRFPTVAFPNPEEPGATDLLLDLARRVDADIAVALDPDADRCAVGVPAGTGTGWRMLTGDETGALLGHHILTTTDHPDPLVANTIVSGSLLGKIAAAAGARYAQTLTGFKWLVRAGDGLVYAYEEAIGHCVDPDAVRDKDGISGAVALAILAEDVSLGAMLDRLFSTHGVHLTAQHSIRVNDLNEIAAIMARLRRQGPTTLAGIAVDVTDFASRTDVLRTDAIAFAGTDAEGSAVRMIARPSGTEPKLKCYVEVATPPGPVGSRRPRAELLREALLADVRALVTSAQ